MANIIIIIVICIFILYFFIRRFRRFSSLSSYSWVEILNPFNSAPLQIYKHLSPENKGAFWSVSASVIIGVISCWLGFSVQYFVYNSTQTESDKLAHYEVVDKFRPKYFEILDSCTTTVIEKMTLSLAYPSSDYEKLTTEDYKYYYKHKEFPNGKRNSPEAQLGEYILNSRNWGNILYTANKIIDASSEIAPYLDSKNSSKLLNNNAIIVASTQIFQLVNDTVKHDSIAIVNKCVKQQVKAAIQQKVSYQSNWIKICTLQYSLYHQLIESNPFDKELGLSMALNQGVLQPMIENIIIIHSCFSPSANNRPLWLVSLIILVLSMCIGYVIMRIIVMKFFDKKSMKPNPQMSQSDYEKIVRKLNNTEKENNQHKVNDVTLLNSIDSFKKELKEKESLIDRLGKEYEIENSLLRGQIRDLSSKLNLAQEENEQLHKRNDELLESKNNSEEEEDNI